MGAATTRIAERGCALRGGKVPTFMPCMPSIEEWFRGLVPGGGFVFPRPGFTSAMEKIGSRRLLTNGCTVPKNGLLDLNREQKCLGESRPDHSPFGSFSA